MADGMLTGGTDDGLHSTPLAREPPDLVSNGVALAGHRPAVVATKDTELLSAK
jgi:hypothetical protein